MKGLILMFLAIVVSMIGWRYCSADSRSWATKIVKDNLLAFIFASAAVAAAIFLSTNTTLRLV